MSEEPKEENVTLTNRLLVIALVVALGAGAAAYYFYQDYQAALVELEDTKGEYNRMKSFGPEVMRLLELEQRLAGSGSQQDPTSYLGTEFKRRGMDVNISPGRKTQLEGWIERSFGIKFQKAAKDTLNRLSIIDTMSVVERNRADLKTKDLLLKFIGNELKDATIQFAQYSRK